MMADVLVLGAVGADHVGGDLGARPHKVTYTSAIVHRVQINPRSSVMHAYKRTYLMILYFLPFGESSAAPG